MWTWGAVAFISLCSLWVFTALLYGREMHLEYLSLYYFRAAEVALEVLERVGLCFVDCYVGECQIFGQAVCHW